MSVTLYRPQFHQDRGQAGTVGNRLAQDAEELGPNLGEKKYSENGLVKPPRRYTRALSPAGMFAGKAPLRLAAQKRRPRAPLTPLRDVPAYFLCKWGV
jgi:hypothetical protein